MKNLKVVSVGSGGLNAVNHMIDSGLTGAEFIAFTTDKYALQMYKAAKKIQLGTMHYALDGNSPARSEQAAIESREEILSALRGADAVIIVAGLGGADGTGASPIIAQYAKKLGALTIAVVTRPYKFEGIKRAAKAKASLKKLSAYADAVVKIRNDKILQIVDKNTTITHAFRCVDEILFHVVRTLIAVCQSPFGIDGGRRMKVRPPDKK